MENVLRHQDLVEADLCCLMCGRLVGQLQGVAWRDARTNRTTSSMVSLTAFRPANPGLVSGSGTLFVLINATNAQMRVEAVLDIAPCMMPRNSGKPLRPGGSPGHPRGGRWIRRCCCRLAPGSLSSRYRCAARSSTSPSAARRRARTARTVASGRKPSTAAMSVTLAICRSPVGRLLSTYGSVAFAAIS